MNRPMWTPWNPCGAPEVGQPARSAPPGSRRGSSGWSSSAAAHRRRRAHDAIQNAIQLSMIVEITSCAPTVALRTPAIPAYAAAASVPPTIAIRMCGSGAHARAETTPSQLATSSPTKYWPWPPMLNIPQRKANATARPVRMSVVVASSVCERLYAATFVQVRRRMGEPVEPGAVEDLLERDEGRVKRCAGSPPRWRCRPRERRRTTVRSGRRCRRRAA